MAFLIVMNTLSCLYYFEQIALILPFLIYITIILRFTHGGAINVIMRGAKIQKKITEIRKLYSNSGGKFFENLRITGTRDEFLTPDLFA